MKDIKAEDQERLIFYNHPLRIRKSAYNLSGLLPKGTGALYYFKDLYDMAIKHKKTNNIPSEKEIFGASASRITYHKKEQRYPRLLNNN